MSRVIDNVETNIRELLDRLRGYAAERLRFATGFLFFNGWTQIEETIPDNIEELKILFGFTDEQMAVLMSTTLTEEEFRYILSRLYRELSDDEINRILSNDKFRRLAESGILKIRWVDRLHGKLYLYTKNEESNDETLIDGRAIVGSSNITRRGLLYPGELNLWLDAGDDIVGLIRWFEQLWDQGEELSPEIIMNAMVNESARRRVLESGNFIDPEESGWTLLDAYLFLFWHLLGGVYDIDNVRSLLNRPGDEQVIRRHNEEPVVWGYQIIERYGGVILADPVGTGKSYQALGIVTLLRGHRDVQRILLIAPPHLIKSSEGEHGHWERYIRSFFPHVRSAGVIENIAQSKRFVCQDRRGEFEIALVSSYGLALLGEQNPTVEELAQYDVIVIDEAHHFKNIDAKKRRVLNRIVELHRANTGSNPYTILLTATPIINDVAEILALLSIYTQGETGDFDVIARTELERNVIRAFERYQAIVTEMNNPDIDSARRRELENDKRDVLNAIQEFLNRTVVLRSRAYIERRYWQDRSIYRPQLRNLTYNYTSRELELIGLISSLSLSYLDVAPSSLVFLRRLSVSVDQVNNRVGLIPQREIITLQGIMKILLAKRLESSVYAFLRTLERMRENMEFIYGELTSNRAPDEIAQRIFARKIGRLEDIEDVGEGRGVASLEELGIYLSDDDRAYLNSIRDRIREIFSDEERLEEIREGIENDLRLINSLIFGDLEEIAHQYSSKENVLVEYLRNAEERGIKVIIYSMYKDTVNYLMDYLIRVAGFRAEDIFIVTGDTKYKSSVVESFREKDGFGIMLSTDALSEGVNLEFVDELINYDIPWTPSVLMQRVGRLWRENRESPIIFYTILPPQELVYSFSTIIEKVEEKLGKIRDILVQEIRLLREEEELTENFEDRVYGGAYGEGRDISELLRRLGEMESNTVGRVVLDIVHNEQIDGRPLREILRERESEFREIEREIEEGRVINMAFDEDESIAIVRFGGEYYFKITGNYHIYGEEEFADILRERWNTVKNSPRAIVWRVEDEDINVDQIVERFRNRFRNYLLSLIRRQGGYEANILNQLAQSTLDADTVEIRELKYDLLILLAYYFYGRRRSATRRRIMRILREGGFVNERNVPNVERFNDVESLRALRERLRGEVESIRVEVIL